MFNESFENSYRMNSAVAMHGGQPFPVLKISKGNSNFPFLFFFSVGI
jgi:hypothetical protein